MSSDHAKHRILELGLKKVFEQAAWDDRPSQASSLLAMWTVAPLQGRAVLQLCGTWRGWRPSCPPGRRHHSPTGAWVVQQARTLIDLEQNYNGVGQHGQKDQAGILSWAGFDSFTGLPHSLRQQFQGGMAMNAVDARLVRAYTAVTDSRVEDNAPNRPGPGDVPNATFDLIVEAAAGNMTGSTSIPYTLTLTAINETTQQTVPLLSKVLTQAFDYPSGWIASGDDFVLTHRETLAVPAGNVPGNLYRYLISMISANLQVVSFAGSNMFILL